MNRQNQLKNALSPYLLQHADNPVHWREWNESAIALARAEDKPILLSVGYAACHWCHVMAHESFEDDATAATMNANFICIKVDREERPDLDRIYQTAHYLLTRRGGGWPLTMFLSPDGKPFFGGTYFPNAARGGMIDFQTLLARVAEAWKKNRAAIDEQNNLLMQAMTRLDDSSAAESINDDSLIKSAASQFKQLFDREGGGLGGAPKFPHPVELEFCLMRGALDGDSELSSIALISLEKMGGGGVFDQVGGGFYRYSVDARWEIPHFEKMLYDNALLLPLAADAFRFAARSRDAEVACQTAEWIMREMQDKEGGGYYSSLDADSEGEEGKFYVWEENQIRALLSDEEFAAIARHFGFSRGANFEGRIHLARRESIADTAGALEISESQCHQLINNARRRLFDARESRLRPGLDDKILSSWNALMIRGMARAGRALDESEWIDSAEKAMNFIRREMMRDSRLLAVWRRGESGGGGYLDDYAFLLDAALELLSARFSQGLLSFAIELADSLLAHFEDKARGGFYFTAADHEQLIRRPKPFDDNATPSGNGVAARGLQRLGWLVGESRYLESAAKCLRAFGGEMSSHPSGASSLLGALGEMMSPPHLILLSGDAEKRRVWQSQLEGEYAPNRLIFSLPESREGLPESLIKPPPAGSAIAAYICDGFACRPPISIFADLQAALEKRA